jgi:hypothetical protein
MASDLESGGAPVDKLDGLCGLDGRDGGVDVLRDDVATIEEADGHVLAAPRIALHHLKSKQGVDAGSRNSARRFKKKSNSRKKCFSVSLSSLVSLIDSKNF